MKQIILISFFLLAVFPYCFGQNHLTIDSVNVSYRAVEQSTLSLQEGIQAIPMATLSLKTTTVNVTKVYLKIRDTASDSVIYQVDYTMNLQPQINNAGITLFENSNDQLVFISPGQPLLLKPYTFEIITEDSSENKTLVFSIIQ